MRNNLHRAVLRRFLLRLSVISAFLLAFSALLAPQPWFGGAEVMAARVVLGACALTMLGGAFLLSLGKRSRPRVTAPRAATSGF